MAHKYSTALNDLLHFRDLLNFPICVNSKALSKTRLIPSI